MRPYFDLPVPIDLAHGIARGLRARSPRFCGFCGPYRVDILPSQCAGAADVIVTPMMAPYSAHCTRATVFRDLTVVFFADGPPCTTTVRPDGSRHITPWTRMPQSNIAKAIRHAVHITRAL